MCLKPKELGKSGRRRGQTNPAVACSVGHRQPPWRFRTLSRGAQPVWGPRGTENTIVLKSLVTAIRTDCVEDKMKSIIS